MFCWPVGPGQLRRRIGRHCPLRGRVNRPGLGQQRRQPGGRDDSRAGIDRRRHRRRGRGGIDGRRRAAAPATLWSGAAAAGEAGERRQTDSRSSSSCRPAPRFARQHSLRGGQAGDRHPVGRARDIIEPDLWQKAIEAGSPPCSPQMPSFSPGRVGAAALGGDAHELADPGHVEGDKRVVLEDPEL